MSKKLLAECFKIFNEGNSFYENKSSASENSATVRVNARYRAVCRIKVDDGIVKKGNTGQDRCDFLFVIEEGKTRLFLFVELKGGGTNGEDAANQLINTIDFFKGKHGIPSKDDKIVGLVVGGRATVKMIEVKERFKKKYGGELIHKSGNKQSYEYL